VNDIEGSAGSSTEPGTPARPGGQPPGADSLVWQYVGQWRLLLVLGRALVLETAHPVVGAGVAEFSTYHYHPWRRAQQTLLSLQRIVYLDLREREREAARLIRVHSHINGVDSSGFAFDALDQEARAWVHLTIFEAVVTMCRSGGAPLSAADEEQLYGEWRACGRLLGLSEEAMPATVADFWVYFERMTRERIGNTRGLQDLFKALTADFPPPAQLDFLPTLVWRTLRFTGAWAYLDLTAAMLPPELQERLEMRPSPIGGTLATVVNRGAALVDKILPIRLRYMPIAAKAIAAERNLARRQASGSGSDADGRVAFDQIDQSGDGVISWADLAAVARVLADRLDVDDEATEDSLYDGFHAWWKELRTAADANGDARLSREEYAQYMATVHGGAALQAAMDTVAAVVDRDGDGFVDQAEYTHLLGGGIGSGELLEGFRRLDADGDGRVTVTEFAAGLGEFFAGRTGSAVGRYLLGRA
jgi:uncharacterized protein (DUF2236 family)/Ca2+-binding EF-hand superfamily protein